MAKSKTKKPKPKTRPLHVLNASGNAFFALRDIAPRESSTRTLCDRPFWYRLRGSADDWRRERVIPIGSVENITNDGGYCRACLKIARMPEAARLALFAARTKAKDDRNEAARLKRTDARTAELEVMDVRIEVARLDALVCLDFFQESVARGKPQWLRRCDRVIGGQDGKPLRCDRPYGHVEMHYHTGTPMIDTGEVVAVAIEAIKRAKNKFDRGPKAWIFKTPPLYCVDCEIDLTPDMLTTSHSCRNCYARIQKPHPGTNRTLVCRFCERVLLTHVKIGVEYRDEKILSHVDSTCSTCEGTGTDDELDEVYAGNCLECNGTGWIGSQRPTVDVHTTLCALKYLVRIEETNQNDESIHAKQLPPTSFVLTHDEDTNEETNA